MSKIFGLVVALGFLGYFVYKRMRMPKVTEAQSVPTGVRKLSYILVGIFLLAGPIVAATAGEKLIVEAGRQATWIPVDGVVTGNVETHSSKGRVAYLVRFRYQAQATDVVAHETLDTSSTKSSPVPEGSVIKALYDPEYPDIAIVDDFMQRWGVSLILLVVGGFLLFYAAGGALQIMKLQSLRELARPGPHAGPGVGKLNAIKKNFFLSMKNQPSWRLIVEYKDMAGRTYTAHSEPIWEYHPETWVKRELDVPLAIDRANPARAWIRVQDYFRACK